MQQRIRGRLNKTRTHSGGGFTVWWCSVVGLSSRPEGRTSGRLRGSAGVCPQLFPKLDGSGLDIDERNRFSPSGGKLYPQKNS